jgi:hypothetical protein
MIWGAKPELNHLVRVQPEEQFSQALTDGRPENRHFSRRLICAIKPPEFTRLLAGV